MKIEPKELKLVRTKKEPKVQDPVRFPKVIEGFEGVAKLNYKISLQQTINEITNLLKKSL